MEGKCSPPHYGEDMEKIMLKKILLIIKVVIIMITTYILFIMWNKRGIVLDYILNNSTEKSIMILKPVYTIGIIIFLLSILIGIIYILFKRRNFNMKKIKQENKEKSLTKYYKVVKKGINNEYYIRPNGLTLKDCKENKDILEVVLNARINTINYGKDTNTIIINATPYKYLKPRIFTLSGEDSYLMNIINLLCVGQTGSGKTYFLMVLLANLLMTYPNAKLYLCDFKNYDFRELDDCKRYFGYTDVIDGIKQVYQIFNDRLLSKDNIEYEPIILYIDEYSALLSNIGKEADNIQKMVAEILFMGRSYKVLPIIGLQRADSILFKNGSRDQFKTIVALGNLSKIQKEMIFPDYKDNMNKSNDVGEGYVYQDGQEYLEQIKVKQVSESEKDIIINVLRNGLDN